MKTTVLEYEKMTEEASKKTQLNKTLPRAFLMGGIICAAGQCLLKLFEFIGFGKDVSGVLTTMSLMTISMVLTGFGLYQKLSTFGGAGCLVPVTGFANSVVAPAIEYKTEGYILGVGAKLFTIAGPVIVYGITASALWGIIYFFLTGGTL